MEILQTIYPYTVYLLIGLSICAFFVLLALFIKLFGTYKTLKLTLSPIENIQTRVENITAAANQLSNDIKDKNNQLKQFLKKAGLFLAAWHIFFPKKDKRRR